MIQSTKLPFSLLQSLPPQPDQRAAKMVFSTASVLISCKFPIASTKSQVGQLRNSVPTNIRCKRVSVACSANFPMVEHFHDPIKRIAFMNYTKDTLWKLIPDSIKDFPWKKAECFALQRLLVLVKETLKWSLLSWFVFSCLSDISYSISRNKELLIPVGLFVGNLMTKYFGEILQEFMNEHKYGHVTWRLLGISCILVLVKLTLTTCFRGGSDFLLHAANGGLMQVVWNWKDLPKQDGDLFCQMMFHQYT